MPECLRNEQLVIKCYTNPRFTLLTYCEVCVYRFECGRGEDAGANAGDGTVCVCTGLSVDVVKTLVPMLVMGTKEKNAAVKSYSEQALVSLLRLRQDDSMLTVCITISHLSLHSTGHRRSKLLGRAGCPIFGPCGPRLSLAHPPEVSLAIIQVHAVTSITDISRKRYFIITDNKHPTGKLFVKAVKMVQIYAENASKYVQRLGPARTSWGA